MTGCWLRVHSLVAAMAVVLVGMAAARGQDPVLVSITGPLVGRVGERASFEVELVNRSGKPLQKLRVIDYFDKGFHHEASASPIEQKGTIDLMPGTARRLTLDFLLDEPGRQCHRVEILDQSHVFVGGATHSRTQAAYAAEAVIRTTVSWGVAYACRVLIAATQSVSRSQVVLQVHRHSSAVSTAACQR